MAAGDKLWFELGVRDEISGVLEALMRNSQKLANLLSDDAGELKNIYKNISDVAGVYDKIYVAQKRIKELKGSTLSVDEKKGLRDMGKELEKVRKEFEGILKSPDRLMSKGESTFDKLRTNVELMVKDTLRYVDGIEAKEKAEAINAANEERRIDSLKAKYYELQRQRKELSDAIANAAPGTNLTNATSLINGLSSRMGAITSAQRSGSGMPASVVGADAEEFFRKVRAEILNLNAATKDYNSTLEVNSRIQKQLEKAYFDAQSQQKIAYIRNQRAEYTALGQKMNEIGRLMGELARDRANVQAGGKAVYTQQKVAEELDAISRRYNETLAAQREQENRSAKVRDKHTESTRKAAQETRNMANANNRLMDTFRELDKAGKSTNRMIDQMASSLGTMFSFYGLKRIVQQVVTIGGQFEFQHVALQNILGDIQEANTLFTQLQELAVESPKTFMELTSYAKQLSAYQIPASELYDTTKRLADMSTGLGVDMGRLILAYGQVRSAAVLRGQELRQFTEAGIPLVQKLADKFTELNGKLTTTADVFKLISARKVPFEMVQEVLWDMTNQGGQFYNMQAELADTLYGKWQKLQDTWQIILGHIADGKSTIGGFMRTMLDGIVEITRGLDTLMPMLAMFGLGRMMRGGKNMFQNSIEKFNNKTDEGALSQMRIAKEKEANRLMRERYQIGRMLTAQEWELIRTKDKVTLNDKIQLAYESRISDKMLARAMYEEREAYMQERINLLNKGYTQEEAKQILLDKERNILMSYRLLLMKGYTKEQITQMRNGSFTSAQGSMTMAGMMLSKLKTGFMSFVGGWPGLIMTAIGGIMSIFSYYEQKAEQLSQKGDAMMSHAQQNANNLKKTLNATDTENSMDKRIEALEDSLINMGKTGESLVAKSREYMDDINKRWDVLKKGAEDYQKILESMGNQKGKALFEGAIDDSDIENRLRKYDTAVSDVFKQYGGLNKFSEVYKEFINEIAKDNEDLAEKLKDKNLFEQIDLVGADVILGKINEKIKTLKKNSAERIYLLQSTGQLQLHLDLLDEVKDKWQDITDKSIPAMKDELESAAKMIGIENFKTLTDDQKKSLETLTREYVNSIAEGSVEAKNKLAEELAKQVFHITIVGDLQIDKTKLGSFANYVWNKFGKGGALGDKGNIRVGKSVYTKAQVANRFDDIDAYDKQTSEEINKLEKTKKLQEQLKNSASMVKETQDKIDEILAERRAIGLDDPKKKGSSGSRSGSKKDTELEKWKEEFQELKAFYSEYKKWAGMVGRDAALKEIQKEGLFTGMFVEGKPIYDISDWGKALDEFQKKTSGGTVDRDRLQTQIKQEKLTFRYDINKEALQKAVNDIQEYINRSGEQWNLYKSLLEKTGDEKLALRAFNDGMLWDKQAEEWKEKLESIVPEGFDIDWKMTEAEAKEVFKGVEGGYELWKKIVDTVRNEYKNALNETADAVKANMSYAQKTAAIYAKYAEKIANARKLNDYNAEHSLTEQMQQELSAVDFEKLKDEINWEAVFGNLELYTKSALKIVKKQLDAFRRTKQYKNFGTDKLKAFEEGYTRLSKAINSKEGLFSGLKNAVEDYEDAVKRLVQADWELAMAEMSYGKNSPQYEKALRNKNLAKQDVDNAEAGVNDSRNSSIKKLMSISDALVKMGKSNDMTLSEVGSVAGSLITALSESGSQTGNLVAAILSLLDVLGEQGVDRFIGNVLGNVGHAVGGVLQGIGNIFSTIFQGDSHGFDFIGDFFGDGYRKYNKAKEEYESLITIWQSLVDEKKRYFDMSWGTEAQKSGEEAKKWLQIEIEQTKILAQERLRAGASLGSHSMEYRMWQGSYGYNGTNWKDVAGEISQALGGIKFSGMSDMLNMTSDQLMWIKENYVGLWSQMDTDFRDLLESIVKNSKEIEDTIDDMTEKLTGMKFSDLINSYSSTLSSMSNSNEELANDLEDKLKGAILKSMVQNIYGDRIKQLIKNADALGQNEDKIYDETGKVVSEYTQAEYEVVKAESDALNKDMEERRDMLKKLYGWEDESNKSSSGSSIKSVTEQTSDLLAGYINAIRADTSVNRITLVQILAAVQSQAGLSTIAQSQLQQLQTLVSLAQERTGFVSEIRDILKRTTNGGDAIKVR